MTHKSRIAETDGDPDTVYEDLEAHEETSFFVNEQQSDVSNILTEEPADTRRPKKE
ncbi:hypothetical protein A8990_104137 [Paenibacillus taihuensis]|uniref:Uncharacterized protein n=1 Tax=Paenibacillus taihuensis TaxID=1156355 RepID=A0A3D9SM06_9BACL|nr:hypothetical protein [Paenibacillus taihuensis]REE91629.1 hypothetical protein A8990_104137 [Paenibacillus taihuensis]